MDKDYFPSSERSIYGQYFDAFRNAKIDTQVLKLLICLLFGFLFFSPISNVFAANFNQSNWSSGVPANASACSTAGGSWVGSECIASDPSDQSGWTAYSSKDTSMSATTYLSLNVSAVSISHNNQTDFAPNTDVTRTQAGITDFSVGTTSNTNASSTITLAAAAASTAPVWSAKTSWDAQSVGYANVPVYVDMDGDGDLDIMIATQWGYIYGYKNIGTNSAPTWETTYVTAWSYPTVPDIGSYVSLGAADLDNDGDTDLMIGNSVGVAYGYENTGSNSAPVWTANTAWNSADIGGYAQPLLVDLDGDSDYDLLQGSQLGITYGYENTGSATSPVWTAKSVWNVPDVGSYSVPSAGDLDNDGDFDLMIGDYGGLAKAYENTGNSTSPTWLAKTSWNSVNVGRQATPTMADVDNDGDVDILIGEYYSFGKAYENTGSQYFTSGNFVSSIIDTGSHSGLNTIEFSATVPANTALTMDVRSGDSATPDGSWTVWQTGLSNGGDISGQGNNRYVQYRAIFSTSDTSFTPSLASVTITFLNFPFASATLVDTNDIKLKLVSATPAWTYTSSWNAPDFGANALPRLVDIDNDGDHDLMVGDNYGYVFGVENTGSDIAPTWAAQPTWNTPTDAGSNVKPDFADLDNDGDFDMLLGDSTGNINGYENTGSKTAPTWVAKPAWNMGDQGSTGVAPALQDLDGDGDFDVLLGTFNGISYGFENTGSVTSPIWATKTSWNAPDVGGYSVPAFADLDGDGDADLLVGSSAGTTYGYENTGGSTNPVWTARSAWNVADIGSTSAPTLAKFESDWDIDLILGNSTGTNRGYKNTGTVVFEAAGQYLSSIINLGPHAGFTTLGYVSNVPAGTAISVDLRSGNTLLPDGSWSAWQTDISNGGNISALPSNRYVQYRINLSATDTSVTPSLSSMTINYSQYVTSATLISSAYDSNQPATILNSLSWSEALPANTDVQIQVRSATDNTGVPGAWSTWAGPDGSAATFWNSANTYVGGCSGSSAIICSNIPALFRSTFGSQWFQYKIALVSSGVYTPTLASIGVEYAVASSSGSGGVTISAISGASSEAGATAYFTVVLDNAPTADVTLGLFSDDLSEGVVSPASLTFTPSNWSTPQTVTVFGVDDAVDDGDITFSIITGAVSSADANYVNLNPTDVAVSNIDNDSSGFTIAPSSGLLTNETGGAAAFSVVLTSQPSANVTIGLSSSDTTEGTVAPSSLTFTPANWSVLQSATVTGVNDAIIDFGVPYSIVTAAAVSADSGYSGVNPVDISVTNEDDDTPDIVVDAPYGLVTSESGGFATLSITLDMAPTSNVSFTLTSSDTSEGQVFMFFPLTFTPLDWNLPHNITVYGVNDGQIDGDQSYSIVTSNFISSDLNFNTANPSDITMSNIDDDDYSVGVTPTTGLVTTEAGGTASFIIRLGSKPSSDVTINMSSSDSSEGVPVQSSITFTPSDTSWQGKTAIIVGVDDRDSDGNQLYTIVLDLVSSDPNFSSIDPPDVTVTNVDDNGSDPLHIENNIMSSQFGGSVTTADVNCDSIPDLLVGTIGQSTYDEVYVYHGSPTGYTTTPDWIGRNLFSNTNFGQQVFSVGDINKDGCEDIVISATRTQSYFPSVYRRGAIYLFNGSASGLPDADSDGIGRTSDASWQVLGELAYNYLGSSVTAGDFNGDSYIDIAVAADSYANGQNYEGKVYLFLNSASGLPDADFDGIGLTSEAAWAFESDVVNGYAGRGQGLAAADVNGDGKSDLMIGVKGYTNGQSYEGGIFAFYGSASGFNDADSDGIAHPSDADWIAESDSTNAYMDVVANAGDVNGDGVDDIIVGASLFETSSGTYNEGKAYIFHGANSGGLPDADSDGIAHPGDAAWQVESNDYNARFGSWVSSAGDYNQDGYGDVIVGAPRYSPSTASVGGVFIYPGSASGVSTTSIWTAQGVNTNDYFGTVVGVVGDLDSDGYPDIFVGTPGNGTGSPDLANEGAAFVYLSNKQIPGFNITPAGSLTTTESGGQTLFSVALDAPPIADVTIAVSSDNTAEGTVSPASLTFTQINWMTPQTITVIGVNDAIADGNIPYLIVLGTAASTDSGYSGLNPSDVSINNIDNDVPQEVGVTVTGGSESSAGSITFTRIGEITAAMTVNYTVTGTAIAGNDYDALSGVTSIPLGSASVTVGVNFINDFVSEINETITIDVAPSTDYAIGTPASGTITIINDDSPGFNIWPSVGLVTSEAGGSDSFVIKLISRPTADVTINLSSSDVSEALVLPASVTFTPSNWNIDQTITAVGQNDVSVDGDTSFTIDTSSAISADSNYNGLAVLDITGTNRDDDSLPTITLSTTSTSVNEGDKGEGIFTISRTGATTDELRVFYSVSGTASSAVDYKTLNGVETIQPGNSSVSINLETVQDDLVENDETVVMTLAGGTDYLVSLPPSNSVTIVDDDNPSTLPLANFILNQTVGEGRSVTVMVILNKAALNYPVTIPYTLTGTATNPADHDATVGSIVIATGTNGSMTFNVVDDGTGEVDETLILTMGIPSNANVGSREQHIITITESNEPPKITLVPQQGGVDARLVVTGNGNVEMTANVEDPNPADTHSFDWSLSNNNLVDINDANPATFLFNPAALGAGYYKLRLTVTDNGTPTESVTVDMLLEVVTSAPALTANDSDNDGIADNAESFDDSDNDGIADYLDPAGLLSTELQLTTADSNSYIMRTESGLTLSLGDVAFAAGADGAYVTTDDIAAYGGGEGDPGIASAQDSVFSPSGYFDFVVTGLTEAGQSVKIAIPQYAAIPASAAYRKYDPQTGWRDFVVDANNSLASAAGTPGSCPLPGDSNYIAGLNEGHYCIQLMIEDGGPNDTDGIVNNIVEDPGSVIEDLNGSSDLVIPINSADLSVDDSEVSNRYEMQSKGGGSQNYLFLSLLLIFYLRRAYHLKQA